MLSHVPSLDPLRAALIYAVVGAALLVRARQ
ncbi:hypothetical protein AGR7B_Cc10538 [Agrobacterium deltaense RV3]|nr:hypothetical protein AGR7B_Cc10538 [Agrobacterium deltaense RV3]